MDIDYKKVEYSRKAFKYIKNAKYLWIQWNKLLITIKFQKDGKI